MDIKLVDAKKEYRSGEQVICVFDHLNLEVKSGEFVAILGPSGCGKTSLLKVIGGFEEGKKPTKDVFMIFQDFNQLFPWRTLGQNIVYAILKTREKTGKRTAETKAREVLQEVGLAEFFDFYPHQLSGGMKQRGALARAIAVESKVLLMDEPFSSLDLASKEAAYELLLKIWKEKKLTVIFVTHDLGEAQLLSGKILYFEDLDGKVSV